MALQRKQYDRDKRNSIYKEDKTRLKESALLQTEKTDVPALNFIKKMIWNRAQRGKTEDEKKLLVTPKELLAIVNNATKGHCDRNSSNIMDWAAINLDFEQVRIQKDGKRIYKYHIIRVKPISTKK